MCNVQNISEAYLALFQDIDFNNKELQGTYSSFRIRDLNAQKGLLKFIIYKVAIFFIVFNPLYWNFGARLEYNTKTLSKLSFGSKKLAVYLFSLSVFILGLFRDEFYRRPF
ncbi:hypothetical protein BRETT_005173 [Brettanomyces bruxellensis]|uniref:Uncharacterized protein n=1 Tax=Dekkera bruxellensis TaxID=5007 RepID=A0A871QYI2_DEKBR|nr:uncharacterized protein BRETT_005173 [Brettanomyces bruxellensis]QOU18113.1 hypothetical protein BRETT_005173 [Brettanomyces bruxellensis]